MDTDHLLSFRTVANSGSFTEAAKILNKSQSTINGQVARLEELLKTKLLIRTTRSCRLTKEGRNLLECSGDVLNTVDRLYDIFSQRY